MTCLLLGKFASLLSNFLLQVYIKTCASCSLAVHLTLTFAIPSDIKKEDVERNGAPTKVASSTPNVLEEYFASHPLVELSDAPRIIVQE